MGWKINGVPFRGDIITVGPSGRDFASVFDALVAVYYDESLDDVLLLVDPATYTCPTDLWAARITGKRVCVRGMGDTPDQTVLFKNQYNGQLIYIYSGGTAIFENCYLHNAYSYRHAISVGHNAQVVVNKALVSGHPYAYSVSNMDNDFTGSILFSNTEIRKGYAHAAGYDSAHKLNLATISLSRVKLDSTWSSVLNVYGGLALADYVIVPTEGYGYNYGDFLITEGGWTIAAKEQYYRRLRNG